MRLGALLIVAALALADLPSLKRAWEPAPGDWVSQYQARLQPVRADLPAKGSLGFITDTDPLTKYYLSCYALVPVLIERGTRAARILGVFEGPPQPILERERLRVIKDYGQGVLLLEKQ